VFWPDAMFWGTTMPSLATTSEAMREYFKGVSKTWGSLLACLGLIGPSDA
jgi:hypothetical protein